MFYRQLEIQSEKKRETVTFRSRKEQFKPFPQCGKHTLVQEMNLGDTWTLNQFSLVVQWLLMGPPMYATPTFPGVRLSFLQATLFSHHTVVHLWRWQFTYEAKSFGNYIIVQVAHTSQSDGGMQSDQSLGCGNAECRARRQEGQDQDFGKCHLKARGGRENPGKDDGQRQNLDLRGEKRQRKCACLGGVKRLSSLRFRTKKSCQIY